MMKMTIFPNQKDVSLMFLILLLLLILAFRFLAFSEFPEILETHAHKKFNLQHNCEIKIPQSAVFRMNHKPQMPQNSKIARKKVRS